MSGIWKAIEDDNVESLKVLTEHMTLKELESQTKRVYDDCNETLMHYAVHYDAITCLEYLLRRGMDPNMTIQRERWTQLWGEQEGYQTALHYAAYRWWALKSRTNEQMITIMRKLLEYGADINLRNLDHSIGWTPLFICLFDSLQSRTPSKTNELVRFLLDNGADPKISVRGYSMLQVAMFGCEEIGEFPKKRLPEIQHYCDQVFEDLILAGCPLSNGALEVDTL